MGDDRFEINVSVPLVLEYEAVATPQLDAIQLSDQDIYDVIDYICAVANKHLISYLWRPYLPDPGDDMVLELAIAAGCDYIITYNKRDFPGIERFGIQSLTAQEFLQLLGELQ